MGQLEFIAVSILFNTPMVPSGPEGAPPPAPGVKAFLPILGDLATGSRRPRLALPIPSPAMQAFSLPLDGEGRLGSGIRLPRPLIPIWNFIEMSSGEEQ
jgi:hypothetical protein